MNRLRSLMQAAALVVVASAPAWSQQSGGNVPVTGPCATPDSVVFHGNQRISETMLRGDAGISPGVALSSGVLQRAIKNLFATGQFDDVATSCNIATNGKAILTFDMKERPVLSDVDVTGPDRLSINTVRDRVDLLVGRPVDPNQVARSVARIDSLYEAEGYPLVTVKVDTTVVNGQLRLTFRVNEGSRLAVSGIDVQGNRALSDKKVVDAMQTKPEGFWWWRKGEYDADKLAGDVTERIPQAYGQNGFIDMQVQKDTVVVDRGRGKAQVNIGVSEGPQYRVGEFEVVGAKVFSSDQIARFYPFGEHSKSLTETVKGVFRRKDSGNEVFDKSRWDDATQKVQEAYANEGYIYAQVRPVIDRVRVGKDSVPMVNLRWEIDERSPAIVNRVEIMGNDITAENCIRDQILVVPGDVFNRDLLIRSYQSIANLGFFETPLPAPETRPNEKGDVDIVFHLKEKRTGNVNFGASVGQGVGVGGFIGFEQPNLFGMCKKGSLQWQFGQYINDFNLAYTDPRIKESRISGTINLYDSQSRYIIANLGRSKRIGGQLQFGLPVRGSRYTVLYMNYGGERVSYGGTGLVSTITCNNCFRSSVGATLTRDTRIDLPFPSAGTTQSITAQFNGGPLGGSASFQRYTAEMRSYATLASFGGGALGSSPIKLVAGLSTRMGGVFGDPGPFFVSQAFSLGGVQYGEPLRGYEEFSITPNGYIPQTSSYTATRASFGNAFYTQSAELGVRFNQMLYLDAFYDAGNLWARPRDFNPTRLFRGVGVGGSIVTPLGPLGVDLGYGLDRINAQGLRDPKWQVHFKFGQIF
ncbi:MAG: outer membrane protein assembly factor BamA [Gemmatimonadetes bacterium]|nr:MAG: outer membrane protein assembly factor BamA [Gemmatimonadota bacterium]